MASNDGAQPRRIYRGLKSLRKRLDNPAASTVYEWIKSAGFPRPVKLGNGHSIAWDAQSVDDWIERHFQGKGREAA